MDKLENVTVVEKANVYYNGNVTSRTIFLENGIFYFYRRGD